MEKQEKTSIARNTLLLCIGGIISKIIGALYKVPLTNILGAEGIGLYQSVFPTFAIFIMLSSGGITQTVSALVSERQENAQSILKCSTFLVSLGVFALSLILFFLSPSLALFQGNIDLSTPYKALIPALIFSGYSAIIRGYFQALGKFTPTVFSQITEQIGKLIFSIFLSTYFLPRGTLYAVTGALVGVSISEFLSLLYLFLRFIFAKDKPKPTLRPFFAFNFLRVLRYALPLSLGGLIMPLSNLIDSVSVVNVLSRTVSLQESTALFGLLSGTVSTLTNLPAVFTVALAIAVVPSLSRDKDGGNFFALHEKARVSIKLALFVCIPVSVFMAILSPRIISFLYPSLSVHHKSVASGLLSISSLGITSLGATQIYSSLLFSLGLNKLSVKNLLISVGVKCALLYPVLLLWGIYGVAGLNALCYILSATLNARTWNKIVGKRDKNSQLIPISVLTTVLALLLFLIIPYLNTVMTFALCLVFVVLYLYIALKVKIFSNDELSCLPFGEKLIIKSGRSKL